MSGNPMTGRSSRRSFLEAAGGLLAVAGATQLTTAGSQQPVRTAVIGTGARGSDLLRALTTIQGCEVVAIADDYAPHLERGAKYAGPQAKTYSDYRKLLAEAKPQAVVIAVPLYLHYQVASDAVAAGCDVFLEKTMCYSVAECRKLAAEVEQAKCVFQVGLQRRANPIYQQAVAMVKAGVIGQVSAIKSQWHRNNNWRRPVPVPKGDAKYGELEHRLNWRLYQRYSQGLMAELGSHQMDVANWVLGNTPQRVIASGGIDYWQDGREVHDNVFCIYDYELPQRETAPAGAGASAARGAGFQPAKNTAGEPSGNGESSAAPGLPRSGGPRYTVRVTYSSLCNNAYEGAAELILGTKGSLFLTTTKGLFYREQLPDDPAWLKPGDAGNAAVLTAGKTLKMSNSPWAHRGEPLEIDLLESDDTRDELVSFLDHVRTRDPKTICDVHEGRRDAATILMANAALESGGPVEYPA
ncbi:MAG TPA: Gfo/Idh/MocA family oxidoreductase [Pirellulaceae bacterium]|nr:Gfo/Idh/MocA family oxidoreductase [Pirellulaceae bacterium]